MVHIHREYYSAIKRSTFESVLMRWVNLEPIIQREVSQKEKDKYCMCIYVYIYVYIYIYIWDLERWYQRSYMQGCKGDADVKNRLSD